MHVAQMDITALSINRLQIYYTTFSLTLSEPKKLLFGFSLKKSHYFILSGKILNASRDVI